VRSLLVLVLLAGSASADVGAGLFAQATRYDGQANHNVGAAVELSIDRAKWQYLIELSVAGVALGDGSFFDNIAGTMYRGGAGVRYLARRFTVKDAMSLELGFEAIAAMQDVEWRSGERDVRPELDVGFTWNIHYGPYGKAIVFRTSVRAFFTSSPTATIACRGPCPTSRDAITSGYGIVTGLSW
jgi:hypothetical protein